MARNYDDYEDLLKNFDDYTAQGRGANTEKELNRKNEMNILKEDARPDIKRQEFSPKADFKPTPIRLDSNGNNKYFTEDEELPTPKRRQSPNSPFYRDPNKKVELPTPKTHGKGNEVFKAAKGLGPKSKADLYLDELDREERRKRKSREALELSENEARNKKTSYKGEVYFSNPPREIKEEAEHQKRLNAGFKSPYGKNSRGASKNKSSAPPVTQKQKKQMAEKTAERVRQQSGFLTTKEKLTKLIIYFLIVAVSSSIICIYGIRCINDVLAIDKQDVDKEVTISTGATDSDVIEILKDNDLIRNELFCKLFTKLIHGENEYVSGSYTINTDWGIEKMLSTMQAGNTYSETITLTFPEGWTVDQIAEKLESNNVCTASSFIKTMQSVDFSTEYAFLRGQENKDLRFRALEGYIYPDTYEFYIGENASSVVRRFLDNFEAKWTADYQKKADALDMTVDEIITLASIIQMEAANSGQMKDISSVLHNRLDKPSTFPWLQCDSTEKYLLETIKVTLTSSTTDTQQYIAYRDLYDTYSEDCKGLPVGAIANPGAAAIGAALNPSDTNYNYFRHDSEGGVYYANTFSEHEQNGYKVAEIG